MLHEKTYNSYEDLAKAIASIPDNHDDKEEVIADMIKKHIHAEKYLLWKNLSRWKGAGIDWIWSRIVEPKLETHKQLSEKWCYGTYYSIRRYGKEPAPEGEGLVPTAMDNALEHLNAKITYTSLSGD